MDRLVKLTQFFMSFIARWSQKGCFKHRKAVSFWISLCSDPDLWSWFLGSDRKAPGKAAEIGFFRRVPGVTLRDKVRSCEIRRALKVEPLLRIEGVQIYWFGHLSRMPHERLARQVHLAKPTKKRFRSHPRPRTQVNYISDLAWPHLGAEPADLSEIAVDREIFQVLRLHPPRPSLEEKRAWKWMKLLTFTLFNLFTGA